MAPRHTAGASDMLLHSTAFVCVEWRWCAAWPGCMLGVRAGATSRFGCALERGRWHGWVGEQELLLQSCANGCRARRMHHTVCHVPRPSHLFFVPFCPTDRHQSPPNRPPSSLPPNPPRTHTKHASVSLSFLLQTLQVPELDIVLALASVAVIKTVIGN